jgi:hypothetical protein
LQACEFDYSGTQACPMTIGPAPMMRIEEISLRLGMGKPVRPCEHRARKDGKKIGVFKSRP